MSRFARLKTASIALLTLALIGGFVDPQAGDLVELRAYLNGRSSANFEPGARNVETVLKPKTTGQVLKVKHFASGNYGLLIDVKNGGSSEKVWIHYSPHSSYVALCRNESGACKSTESVAQARGVETKREVKAYREPASADTVRSSDIAKISFQLNNVTDATASSSVRCNNVSDPIPVQNLSCVPVGDVYAKPDFTGPDRDQKFINYMAPIAIAVQETTGFNASVIIAQAMIETAAGTAKGYTSRNSLFGLSCYRFGEIKTYNVMLGGGTNAVTQGVCNAPRPQSEKDWYVSFDNPIDSVYAYIYTAMQSRRVSHFSVGSYLQAAGGGHQMTYQQAVQSLGNYATASNYHASLLNKIRRYHLDRFDHMSLCP